MGLFSCCTKNVVEDVIVEAQPETIEKGSIAARKEGKISSATSKNSKESKDSGYPDEQVDSDLDEEITHQGDGDMINIGERQANESINVENEVITENSPDAEVNRIINEERPATPEFCLTGVKMTQEPVRKIQSEHILSELESQNIIAKPVTAKAGMAFTIGETETFKRMPSRLPPLQRKNTRKIDKETIDTSLKRAEDNKEQRLKLIREKSLLQEERRQRAIQRKAEIADLPSELEDKEVTRQLHTDDEMIPPV